MWYQWWLPGQAGPWFNTEVPFYQYRKSHFGDKAVVVRSSYLHSVEPIQIFLLWFTLLQPTPCLGKISPSTFWLEVPRCLIMHNEVKWIWCLSMWMIIYFLRFLPVFPNINLHKYLIFPRTNLIVPTTQNYIIYSLETKYASSVT